MDQNLVKTFQEAESNWLSPLAQGSAASLGRLIPEAEHPFRSCYQRDRDRIIHSTAFRRLDGKTQIFLNGKGDYYRTRLTHTIEVAVASRTIARALRLNEDLAESISLAHDLGHPPCGHQGEMTLNELMKDEGGFSHNEQSLRIVEQIEDSYPQFIGLNLSYEVVEGLRKHHHQHANPQGKVYPRPSLEAQTADIADEIAYDCHDLDDLLESGLATCEDLQQLSLWKRAEERAIQELGQRIAPEKIRKHRIFLLRCLKNIQFEDVLQATQKRIEKYQLSNAQEVHYLPEKIVAFDPSQKEERSQLKRFFIENVYTHPEIASVNAKACLQIEALFEHFQNHPNDIGARFQKRMKFENKNRVICDYIAGMTDQYLRQRYEQLIQN